MGIDAEPEAVLELARAEAARIVAEARAEAERVRRETQAWVDRIAAQVEADRLALLGEAEEHQTAESPRSSAWDRFGRT